MPQDGSGPVRESSTPEEARRQCLCVVFIGRGWFLRAYAGSYFGQGTCPPSFWKEECFSLYGLLDNCHGTQSRWGGGGQNHNTNEILINWDDCWVLKMTHYTHPCFNTCGLVVGSGNALWFWRLDFWFYPLFLETPPGTSFSFLLPHDGGYLPDI